LVMDRWQVHRAGALRLLRSFPKRVEIEWLPAYAPDLNPVEQIWNRTKYTDLANYIPAESRAHPW
ncbi:MAG: transposase, partial [Planctomycetes bacterium]|nr:transposase [Planctomycetota bacterium]